MWLYRSPVLSELWQRFARDFDTVLAAVASRSRLIVDLLGNLGGFVGSLRLMSHLTRERLSIGYSLTRKGVDRGWKLEVAMATVRGK